MRGGDGADGKASSWREAADHRPRSDRTADCAASGRGGLDGGAAVVGLAGPGPCFLRGGAEAGNAASGGTAVTAGSLGSW